MKRLDLATQSEGTLGKDGFVSDLVAAALQQQFTGALILEAEGKQWALVFSRGAPVAATGAFSPQHMLGQVLVEQGKLTRAQLAPLVSQHETMEGVRPPFGSVLVKEAGLDPADIKRAVQEQIRRRLAEACKLEAATYKAMAGESPRFKDLAVPCDGKAFLIERLPACISDAELRATSNALLGKSVQLRDEGPGPVADSLFTARVKDVLRYLEKPRKPDHLERAIQDRRAVRVVLRQLMLFERLVLLPAAKAIAIPKGRLRMGQAPTSLEGLGASPGTQRTSAAPQSASAFSGNAVKRHAVESTAPKVELSPETRAKIKELKEFAKAAKSQNHFQVLGVHEDDGPERLAENRDKLAKRFYQDTFREEVGEEVLDMARDVMARVNEAYAVLSNAEQRRDYLRILNDERIQGDAQKEALVRDAETKAEMGRVFLRKKNWEEARKLFAYATEADPVTGLYKSLLAFAMVSDPEYGNDEAFRDGYPLIQQALQHSGGKVWEVHYHAGILLKSKDRLKEALHHFRQAQQLQPRNPDVAREVRLLEGRLKPDPSAPKKPPGGGLGRFFGR